MNVSSLKEKRPGNLSTLQGGEQLLACALLILRGYLGIKFVVEVVKAVFS